LFFLKKGGRIINVEKGIKRKLLTGIRNVKLGQRQKKMKKEGNFVKHER
jgi:hypothetical protein